MCSTTDAIETTEALVLMLSHARSQAQAIHQLAKNSGNLAPLEVLTMIEGMSGLLDDALISAHERSEELWLEAFKVQPESQSKVLEFQGRPL